MNHEVKMKTLKDEFIEEFCALTGNNPTDAAGMYAMLGEQSAKAFLDNLKVWIEELKKNNPDTKKWLDTVGQIDGSKNS